MNVKIYKIDTGIAGRNFSSDKKSSLLIGGKSNSFYSIGNLMRGIEDFYLQGNLYFIDKEEDLEKFENPLGEKWIAKRMYYINHPKKENLLIEANKFHEYIFSEQIREILYYIHSNLNINHLNIEVKEGNDFSAYTNLSINEITLNSGEILELKDNKNLVFKWSNNGKEGKCQTERILESHKVNENDEGCPSKSSKGYVWINSFTKLVNVVKSHKDNGFSIDIEIDNSFEITPKIAKKIGVNPTWLNKVILEVKFK